MIPQYSILCTLLLCGTFLLSGKENSILPEKKTAVKSSAAFENGILEVQSNAKLGGVLLPVRCKAGTRVKIEFEAEGSGSIRSTTRHVEPCGKSGGPPPKAKYSLVTDSA